MRDSGKTYTLFGVGNEPIWSLPQQRTSVPDSWGIVPRACQEIFEALDRRKSTCSLDIQATISVSYVEIFGDLVSDLLGEGKACGRNRASSHRFVLEGSAERSVVSLADLLNLLNAGEAQKRKAATAFLPSNSRSMFSPHVESRLAKQIETGLTGRN